MEPCESDRLLRVPEASELLSISRSKLYLLMDAGELPYVRIGRSRRVSLAELRRLIAEHTRHGRDEE